MKELIKINKSKLNEKQFNTVNARELWEFLGSKQQFIDWMKNRIAKYGFLESQDFVSFHKFMKRGKAGATRVTEYHISIDMAKELAMVENNDRGRQIRRYFIDCEKKLQTIAPKTYKEAVKDLLEQLEKNEALEKRNEYLEPQASKYRQFMESDGLLPFKKVAKVLNSANIFDKGRTILLKLLRDKKILMYDNEPYQKYVDAGYFKIKLTTYEKNGHTCNGSTTYVTPKGLEYIAKLLKNNMIINNIS